MLFKVFQTAVFCFFFSCAGCCPYSGESVLPSVATKLLEHPGHRFRTQSLHAEYQVHLVPKPFYQDIQTYALDDEISEAEAVQHLSTAPTVLLFMCFVDHGRYMGLSFLLQRRHAS